MHVVHMCGADAIGVHGFTKKTLASWCRRCRNLHDGELPLAVQSTCVRLMLNLVEVIMQWRKNTTAGSLEAFRQLVAAILTTLSDKLASVARHTPALLAEGARSPPRSVNGRPRGLSAMRCGVRTAPRRQGVQACRGSSLKTHCDAGSAGVNAASCSHCLGPHELHGAACSMPGMANREERVKKRDQLLASDEARKAGGASRPRMIVYSQACPMPTCDARLLTNDVRWQDQHGFHYAVMNDIGVRQACCADAGNTFRNLCGSRDVNV